MPASRTSRCLSALEESLTFYHEILGLRYLVEPFEGFAFDGREAILRLPSGVALCLQEHRGNTGELFDPCRTGFDHVGLQVDSLEHLRYWDARLTDAGIEHSGIKALPGFGSVIELRDPNGIQLELHCRANQ